MGRNDNKYSILQIKHILPRHNLEMISLFFCFRELQYYLFWFQKIELGNNMSNVSIAFLKKMYLLQYE